MSKKAKNQKSEAELLLLGALGFSIHERVPRIERAADDLGVSPNTFQKYMKALERRGEGIPTDPSTQQELCKLGDEALRLWHEIANLLDERAIRIAMTSHISSNYLPQIVGTVVGRVDNELSVVTLDARADKLCDLLLTGEADFAVGPAYFDDVLRQLTSKKDKDGKAEKRPKRRHQEFGLIANSKLFPAKFVLVSPAGRKVQEETASDPEWIERQEWLLHERGTATRQVIDRAYYPGFSERGPNAHVRAESSDPLQLLEMVGLRLGRTIVADGPAISSCIKRLGLERTSLKLGDAPETCVGVYAKVVSRRKQTKRWKDVERVAGAAVAALRSFFEQNPMDQHAAG